MKEKILVTSALPYVNNVPHLGNIIGAVLSADVFTRFMKSTGRECIYICGADEHGTATEVKAAEEEITPEKICDKYYKIHKEIYEWFNINFDIFGRTHTREHIKHTQNIFLKLYENNFISEEEIEQHYCEKCKRALADRFIEGICPKCNYENARGDQCDRCGALLTPEELIEPKCIICEKSPKKKLSTHLFLELDKLQPLLELWIEKRKKEGFWTENAIRTTYAWFKEGLRKRCITRDLKWGVPVPLKGFENKVFYVWFDAPIGYISITESLLKEKWKDWWQNPENVKLYQFMGKDNIPFHTILFPASLIGTKERWTMLYHIDSTEYLNYENDKFSKSRGIGVFGDHVKDTGIQCDVYRYYLLSNRPEGSDTQFFWKELQEKNNNELVANLGNFINRTLTFIERYLEKKVKKVKISKKSEEFWNEIQEKEREITKYLENVKLKDALKKIMKISHMGNKFFQDNEPWKLVKEDKKRAEEVLFVLANLAKDIAILIEPYLPITSDKIFAQMNTAQRRWDNLGRLDYSGDIGKPEILFEKIEDEKIEKLKAKFGGKESQLPEIELRVGKILNVKKHPNADKLYIEEVDLGTLGKRTIVSGLAPYYSEKELEGKNIILVYNLKSAKLKGVESEGMLLAAEEKGVVEVLETTQHTPGTLIAGNEGAKEITIEEFFKHKIEVKNQKIILDGKELKGIETKIVKNGIVK